MFLKSFLLYYIAAVMCTLSLNINVSAKHLCFNLFIVHTKPRKLFHLIRIYWCFSGWKWLVISTINIFSDSSFAFIFKLCAEDVPSGGEVHWIQLFNGKNNLISKYHNIPEHFFKNKMFLQLTVEVGSHCLRVGFSSKTVLLLFFQFFPLKTQAISVMARFVCNFFSPEKHPQV